MGEVVVYQVAMLHSIVDPKTSSHFHSDIPMQRVACMSRMANCIKKKTWYVSPAHATR